MENIRRVFAGWRELIGVAFVSMGGFSERPVNQTSKLRVDVVHRKGILLALIESLRLHQWAKNLLIFVPLLLAGKIDHVEVWIACVLGFIAWGILASSTYLLNDFWDLPHDRNHWSKRKRPLANGDLPISVALVVAPIGALVSFGITASVNSGALLILIVYGALTLTYSLLLKRIPILDVCILAILFTLRLVFGIQLAGVEASPWLLVFSMFVFTSLSLAKRYTEVGRNGALGREKVNGRGYDAKDGPLLLGLGLSTSAGAIVILVLYLINEAFSEPFYKTALLLWAWPVILFFWLGRIWLLAGRDKLDDDPLQYAVRDVISLLLGAAMVVTFLIAWRL